ncbi:MAG: hypothetical protein ACE5OW_05460 [Candidatus Bathyarchaeia archaeon]
MSANYATAKRPKESIKDNKPEDLTALANVVISISEAATRANIDELPEGSYSHEELMDGSTYGITLLCTQITHLDEAEFYVVSDIH